MAAPKKKKRKSKPKPRVRLEYPKTEISLNVLGEIVEAGDATIIERVEGVTSAIGDLEETIREISGELLELLRRRDAT